MPAKNHWEQAGDNFLYFYINMKLLYSYVPLCLHLAIVLYPCNRTTTGHIEASSSAAAGNENSRGGRGPKRSKKGTKRKDVVVEHVTDLSGDIQFDAVSIRSNKDGGKSKQVSRRGRSAGSKRHV